MHRGDDFIERQIRLPSNQRKQKRRVRFQRRDAAPARLGTMLPVACRRCIHLIAELGLTSNQSAASRRDAPIAFYQRYSDASLLLAVIARLWRPAARLSFRFGLRAECRGRSSTRLIR